MNPLRLLRLVPFAAAAIAGGAQACTDSSRMNQYFFDLPPERHGATPMLRVRITNIKGNVVEAMLDGPYASLSADRRVRITLQGRRK